MVSPVEHTPATDIYRSLSRLRIACTLAGAVVVWALVLVALVGIVAHVPEPGWARSLYGLTLCMSPVVTMWPSRRLIAACGLPVPVPHSVLRQRCHGSLDSIVDSEKRPLRPIGASAPDVARRTGALLAELTTIRGVRIFRGVCPPDSEMPPTAHAISAGRAIIFVESVAFPAGTYQTAADGRIRCDGVYIGQSVAPLSATIRQWRTVLPTDHRVEALIVVHSTAGNGCELPDASPDLAWVRADDTVREIRCRIPRWRPVSRRAVAALVAATPAPPAPLARPAEPSPPATPEATGDSGH
jgi:hypothetical protein